MCGLLDLGRYTIGSNPTCLCSSGDIIYTLDGEDNRPQNEGGQYRGDIVVLLNMVLQVLPVGESMLFFPNTLSRMCREPHYFKQYAIYALLCSGDVLVLSNGDKHDNLNIIPS